MDTPKSVSTQLLEVLLNMVDDYRSRRFVLVAVFLIGSVYGYLQGWNLPMWMYIVVGSVVSVYVIVETILYMIRPYEGRTLTTTTITTPTAVTTPPVTETTVVEGEQSNG